MRSMVNSIGGRSGRSVWNMSIAYCFSSGDCTDFGMPRNFRLFRLEQSSKSVIFARSHCLSSVPSSFASTRLLTVVVMLLAEFSTKFTRSPRDDTSAENFWDKEVMSVCRDCCSDIKISLSKVSMTGWLLVGKEAI